jgi:hypothetical protein
MSKLACRLDRLSLLIINMWVSGKRALKNLGGRVDQKVEDYRATLVRLRERLLAHAALITEATVLQTREDVRKVGTQIMDKMSSHALDAGA